MRSTSRSLSALASVVIIVCTGAVNRSYALQYLGALMDDHYDGLSALTLSPDQQHAYAVSLHGGVFWFNRNAGTGDLAVAGEAAWLLAGTSMIGGMTDAVSPDGKYLYVGVENGLHWFACNTSTGALSYNGQVLSPSDTSVHVYGNFSMSITQDGQYVYVASWYGNAVHWFQRDAVSGALTYAGRMRDSIDVPGRMPVRLRVDAQGRIVAPKGYDVALFDVSGRKIQMGQRAQPAGIYFARMNLSGTGVVTAVPVVK